ncbi:MAG: porin [Burkholderiales bacterium]
MNELLEVLKEKGIITQEEFDRITARQKIQRESDREETKFRASEAVKEEIKVVTPAKNAVTAAFPEAGGGGWLNKKHSFPSTGGIVFSSPEEKHTLMLRGRAELDYRQFGGDSALGADTFDLRRAYLSAEGWLYDDFEYRVRASYGALNGPTTTVCSAVGATSPTDPTPRCTSTAAVANAANTELDEAWLNINWWPGAQFKFGQFKMPFSLEQMQTETFTDFMERSMGDVISPNKERGLQMWGLPRDGLYYALAYSNGQGLNANDTNNLVDGKDILARASVNFPALFGNKRFVTHAGISYTNGRIPTGAALTGRTEARGIQFFVPDAFTGDAVDRTRYGLEAAVAVGPVKFQTEFMRANFSGISARSSTAVATAFDKDIDAYYASLVWMLTGERYADFYRNSLFLRPRPLSNFSMKGGGWGAWELGFRYSKFDAADFQKTTAARVGSGVIPATGTNKADAFTLGLKWLPNPNVRLILNYIETKFDTPITVTNSGRAGVIATTDKERAITLRTQIDF